MSKGYSLNDLLREIQSFIQIDPKDLEASEKLDVNNGNNSKFKSLLKDWSKGSYDESPELLYQRLQFLIK